MKPGNLARCKLFNTGERIIMIKPGDRVNITPYSFAMEERNLHKTGVVVSHIGDAWFRVFVSHKGSTDMIDCPAHVLVKDDQ